MMHIHSHINTHIVGRGAHWMTCGLPYPVSVFAFESWIKPSQRIVQQPLWSPVLSLIACFIAVMDPLQTLLHSIIHVSAVSTLVAPLLGELCTLVRDKIAHRHLKMVCEAAQPPQNDPVWANMPVDVWISLKDVHVGWDGLLTHRLPPDFCCRRVVRWDGRVTQTVRLQLTAVSWGEVPWFSNSLSDV